MILFACRKHWLAASCVVALVSVFSGGGIAAESNTQPLDTQQILKELEQIQKNRSGQFKSGLHQQLDALTAAAASPQAAVKLYEEAEQSVEFEGKPKDSSDFTGWRDKNKDMLADEDFRAALQLHLRYLALSLRRLDGEKVEDLMPALLEYVNQLSTIDTAMTRREKPKGKPKAGDKVDRDIIKAGREIFTKPLSNSVFVRWYRLDGHLGGLKDWEQSSGNIDGIMDKTIMPYMRDKKDARLMGLWEQRIGWAEEAAKKSDLAIDVDKFQTQTLPTLLWRKAQDRLVLGQRAMGLTEMLNIIKTYLSHPDFDKWTKELSGLLQAEAAAAPAAAAPAPAAGTQ